MTKNQVTKKQHYIWQEYLRPWQVNDKVWWKRKGIIKNTDTFSILRENYFYKIKEIGYDEYHFIINNYARSINEKAILNPYLKIFEKLDTLKNVDFYVSVDKVRSQIGENITTAIENNGSEFLKELLNENLAIFDYNNKVIYEYLFFLFYQYFRTKKWENIYVEKMKKEVSDKYKKLDFSAIWSWIKFFIISEYVVGLLHTKSHFITLLKNESNVDFITTDQPIINLSWNHNSDLNVKEIKMLYPISPKYVIIFSNEYAFNQIRSVTEDEVENFNRRLVNESYEFVISKTQNQLMNL